MATDDRAHASPAGLASLTAPRLAALLSGLEGRAGQALTLRFLEGRSRADCAAFFGISPRAFDVMLFRAAATLEAAASPGPRPPLLRSDEEAALATQLALALDEPPDPAREAALAPEVKRALRLLRHLRQLAPEVRAQLEALERAAENSPTARRDVWVRRLLVLLLIAAALYLYQRQQLLAPERPRAPALSHPPAPAGPRKEGP